MSNCFTLSRSSCAWQQQPMTLKSRTWQPPEENKSKKGRFWQTSVNFTSETDVFQPKKTHHAATAGQCIWASKSQNFVYFSGGIPVFVLNIYFLTSCEQLWIFLNQFAHVSLPNNSMPAGSKHSIFPHNGRPKFGPFDWWKENRNPRMDWENGKLGPTFYRLNTLNWLNRLHLHLNYHYPCRVFTPISKPQT